MILIRSRTLIAFVCTLMPSLLMAQMSISSSEILALKGTSRTALTSDSVEVLVEITPGGQNQTWDYRNINSAGLLSATLEYAEPEGGFLAEFIPGANFRQRISAETEQGTFLIDSYWNVTSNQLQTIATASSFGEFSMVEEEQNDVAPLPLTLGSSWISTSFDTNTTVVGFMTTTTDTSWNTVDASGTLRLPSGDFQCLRLRDYNRYHQVVTLNGSPFSTTFFESVYYTWLTEEHLQTFSIDSTENGMGEISMMVSGEVTTSVSNSETLPEAFMLEQNYPNPFNPETLIRFNLPASGQAELTIYNLLGQTVRTLGNSVLDAGEHSVVWNGLNADGQQVPSGVYIYKLRFGDKVETRKMTLLR